MKIRAFADSQGISIDRMNRAAIWAMTQTGREKPKVGGRYGGVELTLEEQALCLKYLEDHKKGKREPVETFHYERERLGWLSTWVKAHDVTTNVKQKGAILAVIGGILCAKDRGWLDEACEGARNGDLLVELAYVASVYFGPDRVWVGFTAYLLSQGFESPGWGIL